MKIQRISVLVFLIILILGLIIWISLWYPAKKPNNTDENNTKDRKAVIFQTLQMSMFSDYLLGVISEYEKLHPDIKIKWIDVPFSEGEKRTLVSILSNNPPDLVNLNPDFSSVLAQKGALEPIDEVKLSEFNKDIADSLKYNGKLYAIPWYATSAVTIYNKLLYKKSGIKKFPRTYEDIAEISSRVKTNTGCYAYFPTIAENDTMLKLLNKYGIVFPENIASAESIRIFNMFKLLYQKDLIPAESITQTHREALEKYMSGDIVFFQGGVNFLTMIKDNAPNIYKITDTAFQITGKLGQNDFSLMNLVIPLKAKYKSEALDFCLYLTNKENQLKLAKITNVISTNKYALKDDFYNSDTDVMARARKYSAKQLTNTKPVLMQKYNQKDINALINTAVQSILLNKGETKDILENISKKRTLAD